MLMLANVLLFGLNLSFLVRHMAECQVPAIAYISLASTFASVFAISWLSSRESIR